MYNFKCDNVRLFKNKNTDLQFTITDRFCERLRQHAALYSKFAKLFCSKRLGYDFRNKEHKFSSKIEN